MVQMPLPGTQNDTAADGQVLEMPNGRGDPDSHLVELPSH